MPKISRPYPEMLNIATQIASRLTPFCERVQVAGSIRRMCDPIGDIEIVAIPKRYYNLFDEPLPHTEVDDYLATLVRKDVITLTKNGKEYKQFIFEIQGIPYQVDLFLVRPETFGVGFLLRTGSAAFSEQMVTKQKWAGLMPNEYRVKDLRVWGDNEVLHTPEEINVFNLWGMEYILPEDRK